MFKSLEIKPIIRLKSGSRNKENLPWGTKPWGKPDAQRNQSSRVKWARWKTAPAAGPGQLCWLSAYRGGMSAPSILYSCFSVLYLHHIICPPNFLLWYFLTTLQRFRMLLHKEDSWNFVLTKATSCCDERTRFREQEVPNGSHMTGILLE